MLGVGGEPVSDGRFELPADPGFAWDVAAPGVDSLEESFVQAEADLFHVHLIVGMCQHGARGLGWV